jgi:hypothetical protein
MNWKTLKSNYPEIWDEVYECMINDLCDCMPQADVELYKNGDKDCRILRLAHNAAFFACDAVRMNKYKL